MENMHSFSPLKDLYGFAAHFREMTDEELVEAFNHEVDNEGWVRARANYLSLLGGEFLSRNLDCSAFIRDGKMSLQHHIVIIDGVAGILIINPWFTLHDVNLN